MLDVLAEDYRIMQLNISKEADKRNLRISTVDKNGSTIIKNGFNEILSIQYPK